VLVCLHTQLPVAVAYRVRAARTLQTNPIALSTDAAQGLATTKATCPFIGSIVAEGTLGVYQYANHPLANIADVMALGNSGKGSTLGYVLELFATGNHAKQLGPDGKKLDAPVPAAQFSLDFPGSQGSHWGHSGILQGNPTVLNSGRWSGADFDRLLAKAAGGSITVQSIGYFIAENIKRDPNSRTVTHGLIPVVITDAAKLLGNIGPAVEAFVTHRDPLKVRQVATDVTKLLGDDNLIGSAGELGLLFAFLEHSPATTTVGGHLAISVVDITSMFKSHRLPAGWRDWTKSGLSWVKFTAELAYHARTHLNTLK